MGALKEFWLETTGQSHGHEINTLLKICKLQQVLLKEVSNAWNPDVEKIMTEVDKQISSLENFTKVGK